MNAKFTDGRKYGAFVSSVQPDGRYTVYFMENGECLKDVAHKDIVKPWTIGKTTQNLDKYIGQTFFDEGGYDEGTKSFLEKGEFKVVGVAANNNFTCGRVGELEEQVDFDIAHVIKMADPFV